MTSAVIDDIGSLIAVAIVVPLAVGGESLTMFSVATTAAKAILFFVLVTVVGGWIFPHRLRGWISRVPFIGKYGVIHILTFDEGRQATLAVLLVALVFGLAATYFGFHPAVGAYMAGLIVKEEYFRMGDDGRFVQDTPTTNVVYEETKRIVDNAAFSWVGPVFFVDLGAKLIFDRDIFIDAVPIALLLFGALFVVQISSAALAARYTGGMSWHQSLMIGFGMLGRAELAFVVMDIAYVQNSIIPTNAFFTLMIAAFFLNVAVPLTINWWRPHYDKAEASRVAS